MARRLLVLPRRLVAVLPPGAPSVGIGLCISGASAYAFLALASHTLSVAQYAPLASFWSLTFLVGPGCFGVLERETGRRVAIALEQPAAHRHRLADIFAFAVAQVLVFAAVLTCGHTVVASRLFDGNEWLVVAAVVSLPSIGLQYLVWGITAGNRRFGAYSMLSSGEGVLRLAGAACLIALGGRSASGFAVVVAAAPAAAVLVAVPVLRSQVWQGVKTLSADGVHALAWLLASSLIQAFLINAGPILVKLLAPSSDAAATGRFLSGLILVRVPLFLYNAASATLMPPLASAAARRDWLAFRYQLDRLSYLVGGIGVVSVLLAATLGPATLRVVFGPAYSLDAGTLCALAVATSLLLLATTWSVSLTATGAVRWLLGSWLLGLAALFVPILLMHNLYQRVELGLIVGAAVAAVGMAAGLYLPRVPRHAAAYAIEPSALGPDLVQAIEP
jgi:O-antigen/teichoic acid export membrane protein